LPEADTSAMQPALVASDEALRAFCTSIRGARVVALDTEFLRVRTYYPELCLLQVAAGGHIACIDPLAGLSLDPLLELLHDGAGTKVMHAARQDLELFYLIDGRLPAPLFDTQIAAALLGFDDQVGYAKLVETLLGITLAKAHTRRLGGAAVVPRTARICRRRRALSGSAAGVPAHGWSSAAGSPGSRRPDLLDPELYRIVPDDMAADQGLTGLRSRAQRAALEQLAAWREREAMTRNRPRQWIVRDAVLLALAHPPATRTRLVQTPELPHAVVDRYASTLLELIASSRDAGDEAQPAVVPTDNEQLNRLSAVVRTRAAEHDLSPSLLAPRRELSQLLRGDRDLALLRGWRLELIGRELLDLAAP
jgi:ribonuclease D